MLNGIYSHFSVLSMCEPTRRSTNIRGKTDANSTKTMKTYSVQALGNQFVVAQTDSVTGKTTCIGYATDEATAEANAANYQQVSEKLELVKNSKVD
jgi:hypothetical protein